MIRGTDSIRIIPENKSLHIVVRRRGVVFIDLTLPYFNMGKLFAQSAGGVPGRAFVTKAVLYGELVDHCDLKFESIGRGKFGDCFGFDIRLTGRGYETAAVIDTGENFFKSFVAPATCDVTFYDDWYKNCTESDKLNKKIVTGEYERQAEKKIANLMEARATT